MTTTLKTYPKNFIWGKHTCYSEQPTQNGTACNEKTQLCKNCHLLNGEYGRVLFEKDLALKNLKVANFRRRDDFQQQRNDRVDGMDVSLCSTLHILLYSGFFLYWHCLNMKIHDLFSLYSKCYSSLQHSANPSLQQPVRINELHMDLLQITGLFVCFSKAQNTRFNPNRRKVELHASGRKAREIYM